MDRIVQLILENQRCKPSGSAEIITAFPASSRLPAAAAPSRRRRAFLPPPPPSSTAIRPLPPSPPSIARPPRRRSSSNPPCKPSSPTPRTPRRRPSRRLHPSPTRARRAGRPLPRARHAPCLRGSGVRGARGRAREGKERTRPVGLPPSADAGCSAAGGQGGGLRAQVRAAGRGRELRGGCDDDCGLLGDPGLVGL